MLDVSIIIVNWNTREILGDCLESIVRESAGIGYEVIVVDNASSDDSAEMVRMRFPQVRLIVNSLNRGFAAANNQGINIATGRYVLLLNSDTVVLDDAIGRIIRFADENKDGAVVGPRVLNPDMTLQRSCFMFPSVLNMLISSLYLNKLLQKSKFFGREQMGYWDRGDSREVDVVTGCFMLIRREAIEEVGVMDERFFMYAEETDLCYRFRQAGWKAMFSPCAEIIHLGGQSTAKIRPQMIVQLKLSILQFFQKHYSPAKHRTAIALTLLYFMLRIPIWLVVYIFDPGQKTQAGTKLKAYTRGVKEIFPKLIFSEPQPA